MINEFDLAKSCLEKLKTYADSKSFDIAIQDSGYEPNVDKVYLEEFLLINDNDQGLSNSSSEIQRPIYQVNVNCPKDKGKWVLLNIVNDLRIHFARGLDISIKESQQVNIEQVQSARLPSSSAHNIYAVSINLSVIG